MTQPAPATDAWYIQAAGKVWGPYAGARMAGFVAEGRVAPDTLVARAPGGPFAPARHQARLLSLFGLEPAGEPAAAARPAAGPEAARVLMVWAAASERADQLETLLGAHGPYVAIHPGLWLVKARMGAAGLRNELTRRLQPGDRLMVVEAGLEQAAWFNLGGDVDRLLRRLWSDR